MSANFFKRTIDANLKVTTNRSGARFFESSGAHMDADQGPSASSSSYRERGREYRGGFRGGRARGNRGRVSYRNHNEHEDREQSVMERLGNKVGYKGRGRDRRGRRGNFARGRGRGALSHYGRDKMDANKVIWYQVTIPYGKDIEQKFICDSIKELLDYTFQPQMYTTQGAAAMFHVQLSADGAEALKSLTKRITLPNGAKMVIIARPDDPPIPKRIEGEVLEKLQEAMSNQYDTEKKVLNLSAFHNNPDMGLMPLNRYNVMTSVVTIISEQIPEIIGLNLSGNNLKTLDALSKLVPKTPHLIALDLSNNGISSESELEKLKGWKNIQEIHLRDTGFFNRFSDTASYLSAVRKIFPKVIKLDGENAPAPIGFDIADDELPPIQGSNFGSNPNVESMVKLFLEEYIKLFDSENRTPLESAYHEQATLSFSYWFTPDSKPQTSFDSLRNDSRNLAKIRDDARVIRCLKTGRSKCVAFLCDFPATTHNLDTLTIDVVNDNEEMPTFTVTGLIDERSDNRVTSRLFSNTIVTIPRGGGYVIVSQQFCFTNITKNGKKSLLEGLKHKRSVASTSSQPVQELTVSANPAAQESMVQEFMVQSGMNAYWSKECLNTNNWDFQKAATQFATLKAEGKIPAEAFVA